MFISGGNYILYTVDDNMIF